MVPTVGGATAMGEWLIGLRPGPCSSGMRFRLMSDKEGRVMVPTVGGATAMGEWLIGLRPGLCSSMVCLRWILWPDDWGWGLCEEVEL